MPGRTLKIGAVRCGKLDFILHGQRGDCTDAEGFESAFPYRREPDDERNRRLTAICAAVERERANVCLRGVGRLCCPFRRT